MMRAQENDHSLAGCVRECGACGGLLGIGSGDKTFGAIDRSFSESVDVDDAMLITVKMWFKMFIGEISRNGIK